MKLQKKIRPLWFAALLCLLVVGGAAAALQREFTHAASASARPDVKVLLTGAIERAGGEVSLEKAGSVNPGEVLHWTISSENGGDAAARDYKAVGQIPHGTTLVAGSATADGSASVAYSIDNGKTYSATPMIEERQPDGTLKQVPAPVSMYTQIRYEWADPLAAASKLNASYKVRVK